MSRLGISRLPAVMVAVIAAAFLFLPLMVVIPMSFSTAVSFEFPPPGYGLGYYRKFAADLDWIEPTINSFIIASGTTLLTLLLSVPASFAYVRHRFRGRGLFNLLVMLPLVVPHVVAALGYYGFLSTIGLLGTPLGVIIAHVALAMPVVFLAVTAALKGFDRNLERAAMSAGAGPLRTFWHVTLPVLRPGILVAALFGFLTSFNEAVVAIFIAGRDGSTLPKKMFESIRLESDPVIAVVSTLLTAAVLLGAVCALAFRSRSRRAA